MKINIHANNFILHPTGVAFWKEQNALLIADVHLGKIAHFRKHGSAVPQAASTKNFDLLDEVVSEFSPQKIYFLGDLFHSVLNKEWECFEAWVIQNSSIKLSLILGNHDIIAPLRFTAVGIAVVKEKIIDQFLLTHEPEERINYFNFCGHIHPGVQLIGLGRQQLKVACFYRTPKQLIFPAFGSFTGNFILKPSQETIIYALAETEVIEVNLKSKFD